MENKFIGRISCQHHNIYNALIDGKEIEARVCGRLAHSAKCETDYPVVGDYVCLDRADDGEGIAVILSLEPRKSLLTRTEPGSRQHSQAIAANLDYLFVCMSCNKNFKTARLTRYFAAAAGAGVQPVAVLTKSDLAEAPDEFADRLRREIPGIRVIVCSSESGEGLEDVRALMTDGATIAFAGSSGVGKSTLINRLCGFELLKTSEIREEDDRGRHTTTHRQLLYLPNGCAVIDTPGMRTLSLDDSDVDDAFSDVEALAAGCRFGDCSHESEPGCAVKAAIMSGLLDEKRLADFKKLKKEERARAARKSRTKKIFKN